MNNKLLSHIGGNASLLQSRKDLINGIYNGYYVLINNANLPATLRINVSFELSNNEPIVNNLVQRLKMNKMFGTHSFDGKVFTITLSSKINSVKYADMVHELLDLCTSCFYSNSFPTGCAVCGQQNPTTALTQVESRYEYICDECYRKLDVVYAERRQNASSHKSNVVLGITGAILGAAIGGVLWVLVGQLGYIVGIVGFIIAALAFKGYELLGGKLTKVGIVISVIAVLLTVYFAHNIGLALDIKSAFADYYNMDYSFSTCYNLIPDFLREDVDVKANYIRDLIVGYIFVAAASFSMIKSSIEKINVTNVLKRV